MPDLRNSKVADLVSRLPRSRPPASTCTIRLVSVEEARHEYGLDLIPEPAGDYDLIVLAVPHARIDAGFRALRGSRLTENGSIADLKNVLAAAGQVRPSVPDYGRCSRSS